MSAARRSSLNPLQPPISPSERKQPRQRPLSPSTTQTLTQGVAIGTAALDGMICKCRRYDRDASVTISVSGNYIEVRPSN